MPPGFKGSRAQLTAWLCIFDLSDLRFHGASDVSVQQHEPQQPLEAGRWKEGFAGGPGELLHEKVLDQFVSGLFRKAKPSALFTQSSD